MQDCPCCSGEISDFLEFLRVKKHSWLLFWAFPKLSSAFHKLSASVFDAWPLEREGHHSEGRRLPSRYLCLSPCLGSLHRQWAEYNPLKGDSSPPMESPVSLGRSDEDTWASFSLWISKTQEQFVGVSLALCHYLSKVRCVRLGCVNTHSSTACKIMSFLLSYFYSVFPADTAKRVCLWAAAVYQLHLHRFLLWPFKPFQCFQDTALQSLWSHFISDSDGSV